MATKKKTKIITNPTIASLFCFSLSQASEKNVWRLSCLLSSALIFTIDLD